MMSDIKSLLELKKKLNKTRPNFVRQDGFKRKRL